MKFSFDSLVSRISLPTFDFLVSASGSLSLELESVFTAVLFVSLIGGIVALVGLVLQKLMGRFLPNRLMYFFWILIVFRFVLFFVPASPTSVLNLLVTSQEPSALVEIDQEFSAIEPENYVWPTETEFAIAPSEPVVAPIEFEQQANYWKIAWFALQIAWLIGLAVYVLLLAVQAFCVYRLVRSSSSNESEKLNQILADARASTGVQSRVQLRITNRMNVPAMVGLIHPTILLPAWCEHELSRQQLKLIFSHELIHVRSRDGLVQLLAHMVTILHWFNPLVRYAVNQIAMYRELACDQQVLAALVPKQTKLDATDGPIGVVRLYGETILQIAERCSNQKLSNKTVAPEWIPGFIGSRQKMVIERIQMLDHPNQKSRFAIASGLACAAFLIAVGFTAAQESQPVKPLVQSETGSSTQTAVQQPVAIQENQPDNESNEKTNSFANANSVQFRVQVFEGKPDAIRRLLQDCGVEAIKNAPDDMAMAGVLKEQVALIRKQLNDEQQLFGTLVSGRNKQKLRAESIKEIEIGSDNNPQTKPVGLRLEITPILRDAELIVECRIEESFVTYALAGNVSKDGKRIPGFSVKRMSTGIKLKHVGDAVLLTQTMVKEQSKNKDDLFTSVYLIQPIRAFRADNVTFHQVKEAKNAKDVSGLRLTLPEFYATDSGDVLGMFIEGVLGGNRPTVNVPELGKGPPTIGYPVPVRSDGTISLPLIKPIAVRGLTLQQIEALVQRAYRDGAEPILNKDARMVVTLMRARTVRVFVVRADGSNGKTRGFVLNLPAYKNDVFNALMQTGGMPGINANKVLQIARGADLQLNTELTRLNQKNPGAEFPAETIPAAPEKTDKINLNGRPHFRRDQIELHQNDVVYVNAKNKSETNVVGQVLFDQPASGNEKLVTPIPSVANEPDEKTMKDWANGKLIAYKVEYFEADIQKMKTRLKSIADKNLFELKPGIHLVTDNQNPEKGTLNSAGLRKMLDYLEFGVIDQPVLVASTSRPAELLSGGEICREGIVQDIDGSFKKCQTMVAFGLKLKFTPRFSGEKLISDVEVAKSWLNPIKTIKTIEHGIELEIPQLYECKMNAVAQTLPGESFAVVPEQISIDCATSNPNGKIGLMIVAPKKLKNVRH